MRNCRFGDSKFNLCSLIKMTGSSWKMNGDTTGIYSSKGAKTIDFNIPITTPEGRILAIKINRTPNRETELSLASPNEIKMSI